ncbi:cobalamin biosynthesis CobW [Tanacetum coccineum]
MVSVVLACCSRVVGLASVFDIGTIADAVKVVVAAAVMKVEVVHWDKQLDFDHLLLFGWQSTLLNHILTAQHDKQIAIIEYKCGEVDIDGHGSLVASYSSANEDIVMVNNSCLCCTIRGLAKRSPLIETFCMSKFLGIVVDTKRLTWPCDTVRNEKVSKQSTDLL